jgi:hypothetical protein
MKVLDGLRAMFASGTGDEVAKLESLLAEAEQRQRAAGAALADAKAAEARALAAAVVDGTDANKVVKVREQAAADAGQADALVAGIRDRLRVARDTATAQAEAERQAERVKLARELIAAGREADAAVVAAGAALAKMAEARARLWEVGDRSLATATLRGNVVDALVALNLWKGSNGRFGSRLPLTGRDESLSREAFVAKARDDAALMSGVPQEVLDPPPAEAA